MSPRDRATSVQARAFGGWEEGENPDPLLLVFLEASAVIFIKDGAPGIDVDDGHGASDEQHERELHHVADLHQHDGGDERQHGDVVVILGVLHAAVLHLHPRGAVAGSRVVLEAAKLEAGSMRGEHRVPGNSRHQSEKALSWQGTSAAISHRSLRNTEKDGEVYQEQYEC